MADSATPPEVVTASKVTAATPSSSSGDKEKAKKVANTSKRGRNEKKGIIEVEPVMGTRDFFPEDMRVRTWLFDNFRAVASSFCFQVRRRCPNLVGSHLIGSFLASRSVISVNTVLLTLHLL
jgi:hypothetical protein